MPQESIVNVPQINPSYFDNISFFSKQFCLPKEIKLVDYHDGITGRQIRDNIQIVDRINYLDINPVIRNIIEVSLDNQSADPGDGLISFIKHLDVKLAICITVYTEDKKLLKKTLEGIMKNYEQFYKSAGIQSHQIAVVIMFDGIQYLNNDKQSDKNMFNLFREFDLVNGFRKKEYLLAKEKEERNHSYFNESSQESQMIDIQNFADDMLFTQAEYEELQGLLLEQQYKKYKQMSEILDFSDDIEKKKLHSMRIDQLPPLVRQALATQARIYLQSNGIDQITENNEELINYIQSNLPQQRIETLKIDALTQAVAVARQYLRSRENTAIMYQMALPLDSSPEPQSKMNLFTVVKYSNRGKLSSHLWFFEGFCSMINPSACVLLDCGLQPANDSIFKMWTHIETYKQTCGGVCGYMKLRKQSPYDDAGNRPQKQSQSLLTKISTYLFDIQKAQVFEYHFAHLLDKPFEGLTGYIHVLPGAFSGYNWDALKSQKFKVVRSDGQVFEKEIEKRTKQQILKKYLKTVIYNQILDDIAEANMYLAEDRILCLEIYTKKKNEFNLEYLPDAQGFVDPITTVPKLLSQRKRWMNGSWFALQYVLKHRGRVSESDHNCWDKLWFHFNMFHAQVMRVVSYLSLCFFFVTMHLMIFEFAQTTLKKYFMISYGLQEKDLVHAKIFQQFFSIRSLINAFTGTIDFLYVISIGILVYRSLTIRKQDVESKRSFNTISTWLGVFGLFSICLVFINFYQAVFNEESDLIKLDGVFTQRTFIYLIAAIVSAHFLIMLSAFNCYTYYEIISSLLSYFFYMPVYINLFFIYSFCRIDDLSWGTKGLDTESKATQSAIRVKFANDKIKFTLKWLGANIIVSLILVGLANNYVIQNYIIWIFSAYFAGILLIKTIFLFIYLINYNTCKSYRKMRKVKEIKKKNEEKEKKGESIKNEFDKLIKRMKERQIGDHISHIKEEMIMKRIFEEDYSNQKNKLISLNPKSRDQRLSFKDLQRISSTQLNMSKTNKFRAM